MGNSKSKSENEWDKTFNEIKSCHDEAYRCIDCGITLEEENRNPEALEQYKNGIALIDKILNVYVECPDNTDETWQQACNMIQKMKRTRAEVLKRICAIQSTDGVCIVSSSASSSSQTIQAVHTVTTVHEAPPSYEAVCSSHSEVPHTYTELANALENLEIENKNDNPELILLYTQDNVQVYFISPDGNVASLEEKFTLKVYTVPKSEDNVTNAFLQINDWIYPLIPGVSPCYRARSGALIVPDTNSPIPGTAIGLVLPPEADLEILLTLLDDIIHGVVSAESVLETPITRMRRHVEPTPYSSRVSSGIVNGAWYIREGLIKGAEMAGSLLNRTTPVILKHVKPVEQPTEISPTISKGLQTARKVTGTAATATGFVVQKVGGATVALGRYLAPYIERQGTKLLTTGFNMDENKAHKRVDDIMNVAASAVEGLATVYSGLEQSADILGESLTKNTVKIVEHKYGPEVGNATGNSINIAGDVWHFTHSVKFFKPSVFAKVAAKNAGKAIIEDYKLAHQHDSNLPIPNLEKFDEHITNVKSQNDVNPLPSTSKLDKNNGN